MKTGKISLKYRVALPLLAALSLSAPRVLAQGEATAPASTRADSRAFQVADAAQDAFVRVAEKIRPSVVNILAEREKPDNEMRVLLPPTPTIPGKRENRKTPQSATPPDDEDDAPAQERTTSLGSGMVVRADGFILTNYHVVKGAVSLRVFFDFDSERPDRPAARLVGFDEESDLALLKIERDNLRPVEFADSDLVKIGQWAIAIGAPFEQAQSVTVGVVSAKGRHLPDKGRLSLQDYLQTDASINPGNSGGPLIDLEGRVIGINTAILSPSRYNVGVGFAVPANTIRDNLPALFSGATVKRGFLGVSYTRLDAAAAKELDVRDGVQIAALARDDDGKTIGPASAAGLLTGDIISAINGVPIDSSDTFRRLVSRAAPGDKMVFDVTRPEDGATKTMQIAVRLSPWPGTEAAAASTRAPKTASLLGLEVGDARDLSSAERVLFPFDVKSRGAVIRDISPGSPADEAQLSRGQIIVRARLSGAKTWQKIGDKNAWRALEKTLAPGVRLLLQLQTNSGLSSYRVVLAPPKNP